MERVTVRIVIWIAGAGLPAGAFAVPVRGAEKNHASIGVTTYYLLSPL
jgi:hypothetical protein